MQINLNELKSLIHQIILQETTPNPKSLAIARKLQDPSRYSPSLGKAYDKHSGPNDTISQLADLRRTLPRELFTDDIEKLIKNEKYDAALEKLKELLPLKENTELTKTNPKATFEKWFSQVDVDATITMAPTQAAAKRAYNDGRTPSEFTEEWEDKNRKKKS